MKKTFIVNGESLTVDQLVFTKGEVSFSLNGNSYLFRGKVERDGNLVIDGQGCHLRGYVGSRNAKGTYPVMLNGGTEASVHPYKPTRKRGGGGTHKSEHTAPMAGTVQKILVAEGTAVEAGQKLVVIEAMKLQLPIEAAYAGKIIRILFRAGETVADGDLLVEIEKSDTVKSQ